MKNRFFKINMLIIGFLLVFARQAQCGEYNIVIPRATNPFVLSHPNDPYYTTKDLSHIIVPKGNYHSYLNVTFKNLALSNLFLDQKSKIFPLDKVNSEDLVKFFLPEQYLRDQSNVFRMKDLESQAFKMAQVRMSKWDPNKPYRINTTFAFNKNYDFKGGFFPLSPLSKNSSFTILPEANTVQNFGMYRADYKWPWRIYFVYFDNPKIINNLPMSQALAEKFLDKRTQYGYINTNIKASIKFVITGLKSNIGGGFIQGALIGHIQSVTLFHNNGKVLCEYN